MELLSMLLTMAVLVTAIVMFIRYEPRLDLVKSGNKYILFLWYNKYNWLEEFEKRAYIKLFEV